ncbi:aspartate-alanine antiporter [Catellatospora sp. NEAU-YM18]|nr:aspartate-alanine antiporter [Catellatospora tritici]
MPELALFLSLGLGFALGRIRFWGVDIGGTAGTLIVALLIGMIGGVTLNREVRDIAFALFIFTLGYMAGPSFFSSLNAHSLRYASFTAVQLGLLIVLVCVATVVLRLDQGTAAGLAAGSTTASAALGTAGEAIGSLPLPLARRQELQVELATTYSVAYICSLITLIVFTGQLGPKLFGLDLRREAEALLGTLGDRDDPGTPAVPGLVGRIFEIQAGSGRTVEQVETELGGECAIERLRRDGDLVPYDAETVLRPADRVLVVGSRADLLLGERVLGPETTGAGAHPLSLDSASVVITDPRYRGWTLARLHEEIPARDRHGVFVTGLSRMEHALPVRPATGLHVGDTLHLTGTPHDLETHVPRLGVRIDPTVKADLSFIALGVVAGMLLGRVTAPLGPVPLSLGIGGGCLLSGLLFGWLRARRPTFGQYHPAAAAVIKDYGLATFVAAVGLGAGPAAIDLIRRYGPALPLAAVLLTLLPALAGMWLAVRLMKLPAPLACGCVAGQQCSTPTLATVQRICGNGTPLLSYTIVYAFSAVALPLLGPLIVALAGLLR